MTRANGTCIWCGKPVDGNGYRCGSCKELYKEYKRLAAAVSKHSSVTMLCRYRNLLYDMLYNMPNATDLPYDVEYQYERVCRYLSLKDK